MQTFLPYADFRASAAALDARRLGKQRAETIQTLRALTVVGHGFRRHPAAAMWAGYEEALVRYGLVIADAWTALGHADTTAATLATDLAAATDVVRVREQDELAAAAELPPWLGDAALHLSHQSALVRKDAAFYRPLFGEDVPTDLPYLWPTSDRARLVPLQ